jgi:hypothetical protein
MGSATRWVLLLALTQLACGRESSKQGAPPAATLPSDSGAAAGDLERRCKARDYRACEAACDQKEARACVVLGEALMEGRTGRIEDARGRALVEQACREGAGDGCFVLAVRFMRSPDRDLALSRQHFARGCELKDWASCVRLADLLRHGRGGPADATGADQALKRACDGGMQSACNAPSGTSPPEPPRPGGDDAAVEVPPEPPLQQREEPPVPVPVQRKNP